MLTPRNFVAHVTRLVDPATPPEERLLLVTSIRDNIEVVYTQEYNSFLSHFIPALKRVLTDVTSPQTVDNEVHKARNVVLEVLNRLPHIDALRPYVSDLLTLALLILRTDNEENAVTALRIIFDLHKNFRPYLEAHVQEFLVFVAQLYRNFTRTVNAAFAPPATGGVGPGGPGGPPGAAGMAGGQPALIASTHSFKVVIECPLIVMFLFQLYPKFIGENIPVLLPLMVSAIEVTVPPTAVAPPAPGVARASRHRLLHDFIAAQVKTVSFLSYLLKQFHALMKPHEASIPRSVVQLLLACPGDAVAIRKELLVAVRHILATDFRAGFFPQIDLLLDEKVLVGTGRVAYDTLRPLAYSFLAELVHYVRHDLTLPQLSRVIYLFGTNVHDPSLSFSMQTTSVRLLLNLIEGILGDDSEVKARQLLIRIMDILVSKFATIKAQVPRLLSHVATLRARGDVYAAGRPLSEDPVVDPMKEINECKHLIKTLTLGLKTVVWSASNIKVQPPPPPTVSAPGATAPGAGLPGAPPGTAGAAAGGAHGVHGRGAGGADGGGAPPAPPPRKGLTEDECAILTRLLESAMDCFRLYGREASLDLPPGMVVALAGPPGGAGVVDSSAPKRRAEAAAAPPAQVPPPRGSSTAASVARPGSADPSQTGGAAAAAGVAGSGTAGLASRSGPAAGVVAPVAAATAASTSHAGGGRPALPERTVAVAGGGGGGSTVSLPPLASEKEILDQFAQIFTVLDARNFQDVFGLRMPELFDEIVRNSAVLAIPQHFLANVNISKYFADILLSFVVSQLPQLGSVASTHARRAPALLRLFKILFASVTLFSDNEPVLHPHLATIVRGCLTHAAAQLEPGNYLQLLRALFKSLSVGKHKLQFELLYRDLMPLVESLFQSLLKLHEGPHRLAHRDIFIELCLIVPARPSTIFPHLSDQLKPITLALSSGSDLIALGLRTLEFWVDTLQPDYLDRLLTAVEPGLTRALFRHVRPAPYPYGSAALRIFGKLGSRMRRFPHSFVDLSAFPLHAHPALRLHFKWNSVMSASGMPAPAGAVALGSAGPAAAASAPAASAFGGSSRPGSPMITDGSPPSPFFGSFQLPLDDLVQLATEALLDERPPGNRAADGSHKKRAYELLKACLSPFLDLDEATSLVERDDAAVPVLTVPCDAPPAAAVPCAPPGAIAAASATAAGGARPASAGTKRPESSRRPGVGPGRRRRTRAIHHSEVVTVTRLLVGLLAAPGDTDLLRAFDADLHDANTAHAGGQPGSNGGGGRTGGGGGAGGGDGGGTGGGGGDNPHGSSSAVPPVASMGPRAFADALCRHFALLEVHRLGSCSVGVGPDVDRASLPSGSDVRPPDRLEPDLFVAALVQVLARERREHAAAGLDALRAYVDALVAFEAARRCSEVQAERAAAAAQTAMQGVSLAKGSAHVSCGSASTPGLAAGVPGASDEPSSRDKDGDVVMAGAPSSAAMPAVVSAAAVSAKGKGPATAASGRAGGHAGPAGARETMSTPSGVRSSASSASPAMAGLIERLCHCCYERTWYQKWAGAAGLGIVARRAPPSLMRDRTSACYEVHVVCALLFVERDLAPEFGIVASQEAASSLATVLEVMHGSGRHRGRFHRSAATQEGVGGPNTAVPGGGSESTGGAGTPATVGANAPVAAAAAGTPSRPAGTGGVAGAEQPPLAVPAGDPSSGGDGSSGAGGGGNAPSQPTPPLTPEEEAEAEDELYTLREVTKVIEVELLMDAPLARAASRRALEVLARVLGCTVSDVLMPVRDSLLKPLSQRQLRQLPFPGQIAYVHAVTYCLSLRPVLLGKELLVGVLRDFFFIPLIEVANDMTMEKLTEAEEGIRHKLVENKLIQVKTVDELLQLRRQAVEFLCAIVTSCPTELQAPENEDVFRNVVAALFRSLQSRDKELVAAGKRGLPLAIQAHPAPKELLQTNLRPVLGNLVDYKKLTIPYLCGLSRVLELLSAWFNVNLGDKLLEHLVKWTEPEKLAATKKWVPGTESSVAAAILDLYHLMPQGASKFFEPFVLMVLRLEAVLTVTAPGTAHLGLRGAHAASTSPYREPLLRYSNKHSAVAVDFFLSHLHRPPLRGLFMTLLRAEGADPLRKELMNSPQKLLSATFRLAVPTDAGGAVSGVVSAAAIYGVLIVDALERECPGWLASTPAVFLCLLEVWRSPGRRERLAREQSLPLEHLQESRILASLLLTYVRAHPEAVEVLFALLSIFSVRTLSDFTFVRDFYTDVVGDRYAPQYKRAIMVYFLKFFAMPDVSQEHKVHALQLLVTPMLEKHLSARSAERERRRAAVGAGGAATADKEPGAARADAVPGAPVAGAPTAGGVAAAPAVATAGPATARPQPAGPSAPTPGAAAAPAGASLPPGADGLPVGSASTVAAGAAATVATPATTGQVVPDIAAAAAPAVAPAGHVAPGAGSATAAPPAAGGVAGAAAGAVPSAAPAPAVPGTPGPLPAEVVTVGEGGPSAVKMDADDVLDTEMIDRIMRELLDQPDEVLRVHDEPLSAELLQLATLLLKFMPVELSRYRKEVIKFGWNHLKREDSVAKQWAFVNVSRFIEAYQAPDKIILQVYVALLRACQQDGRALVRQALDILTPALPRRLVHNPVDHKYPIWIRYTKKILLEEGHSLPHLVHIWQLIVRHSSSFYAARAQFVPIMVNLLSRMSASSSASLPEYRRLAVDLADLVISWDIQRIAASRKRARPVDMESESGGGRPPQLARVEAGAVVPGGSGGAGAGPTAVGAAGAPIAAGTAAAAGEPAAGADAAAVGTPAAAAATAATAAAAAAAAAAARAENAEEFRPTPAMTEMVVNFLARVAFTNNEARERKVLTRRCLALIDKALGVWPNVSVRLVYLEKILDANAPDARGPGGSATPSGGSGGGGGGGGRGHATQARGAAGGGSSGSAGSSAADGSGSGSGGGGARPGGAAGGSSAAAAAAGSSPMNSERAAAQAAALATALELALVLLRRQGAAFTRANAAALRAMVSPSLEERSPRAAAMFAQLLARLLVVSPPEDSPTAAAAAAAVANAGGGGDKGVTPAAAGGAGGGAAAAAPGGQAPSADMALVYTTVDTVLDRCLRTSDTVQQYNALVVLRAVVNVRPSALRRYIDPLVRALHRLTLEIISVHHAAKEYGSGRGGGGMPGGGGPIGGGNGGDVSMDGKPLMLCLNLLGNDLSVLSYERRRAFFQIFTNLLLERCHHVPVLIEAVRLVSTWVLPAAAAATESPVVPAGAEAAGSPASTAAASPAPDARKEAPPPKEVVSPKEKVTLMMKLVTLDRVGGSGSRRLQASVLDLVYRLFAGESGRQTRFELLPGKTERLFLDGLRSTDVPTRRRFFALFTATMPSRPLERLLYILAKQDWEPLSDSFWIRQALDLLLAVVLEPSPLVADASLARFPAIRLAASPPAASAVETGARAGAAGARPAGPRLDPVELGRTSVEKEEMRRLFMRTVATGGGDASRRGRRVRPLAKELSLATSGSVASSLRELTHLDSSLAHRLWVRLFPQLWASATEQERTAVEAALGELVVKEYHLAQASWRRNVVQVLLEGAAACGPDGPILHPAVLLHVARRWNAWHAAAPMLEARIKSLNAEVGGRGRVELAKELVSTQDALAALYHGLGEFDCLAAQWKMRATNTRTVAALELEQRGEWAEAQDVYCDVMARGQAMIGQYSLGGVAGAESQAEMCLWQERSIVCAKQLSKWDTLTEYARTVMSTELLHDCVWRIPDWSSLKELLHTHPVEDSLQLKMYEAYKNLQENKLDAAEQVILVGFQRALERLASVPESAGWCSVSPSLTHFQQLVELQESVRILAELNAISSGATAGGPAGGGGGGGPTSHGAGGVGGGGGAASGAGGGGAGRGGGAMGASGPVAGVLSMDARVENVRVILAGWRDRLPNDFESPSVWNDLLTWRNHMHQVVVNVLQAMKDSAASSGGRSDVSQQALVIGVNETAANVHRYARALRKQNLPEVAIHALQRLYPFQTMELNEYFVKTKETAKAFLASPREYGGNAFHVGLSQLNGTNMDMFNDRQKAQLFTLKGRLFDALQHPVSTVNMQYATALAQSEDVGSAWLAWAHQCDKLHEAAAIAGAGSAAASASPAAAAGLPSMSGATAGTPDAPVPAGGPRPPGTPGLATADPRVAAAVAASSAESLEQELQWREAAANCYLAAVRFGSRKARTFLPRALRLLSVDVIVRLRRHRPASPVVWTSPPPAGAPPAAADGSRKPSYSPSTGIGVEGVFAVMVPQLPMWVWLPWLQQLVPMLARAEAAQAQQILSRMAQTYPQALFFLLRSFLEERFSIDRPTRNLTYDALKAARPNTVAVLPAEASAQMQLSQASKHMQSVQGVALQAKSRLTNLDKVYHTVRASAAAATTEPNKSVVAANAQAVLVELHKARRMYERTLDAFKEAQRSHAAAAAAVAAASAAQAQHSLDASPHQRRSADKEQGPVQPGQPGSQQQGRPGTPLQNRAKPPSASPQVPPGVGGVGADTKPPKPTPPPSRAGGPRTRDVLSTSAHEHGDTVMAILVQAFHPLYVEMERVAQDLAQRTKPQQEEQLLGLMNALLHRCYQLSTSSGSDVQQSLRAALEEVSRMCFATRPPDAKGGAGAGGGPSSGRAGAPAASAGKVQASISDLKAAFEAELAPQTATDFPTQIEPFIARLRRWKNVFQRRVDSMPEERNLELLSRHLMDLHESEVDVPGQYLMAIATEPSPDRHVKIERFGACVRVVRRHSVASRGLTLHGNDGKQYRFVLETSVNAVCQRQEERSAQLCRLFNASFLSAHSEARRRRLALHVPVLVPTGYHTRLVSDNVPLCSLSEALERHCEAQGGAMDDPLVAFRRLCTVPVGASREEVNAARHQAFLEVCRQVPITCLSTFIGGSIASPAELFAFKKRFAETLGIASIVSYALVVGARRPQNLSFSWTSGAVVHGHMRPLVSARGLLECDETVPFRLTRNMYAFLGRTGVTGALFGGMAATVAALQSNDDLLDVYLHAVVRDELSIWAASQTRAATLSAASAAAAARAAAAAAAAGAASPAAAAAASAAPPGTPGTPNTPGGVTPAATAAAAAPAAAAAAAARAPGGGPGSGLSPGAVTAISEFDLVEERLQESVRMVFGRLRPAVGPTISDGVAFHVRALLQLAQSDAALAQMVSSWHAWF